jgi:hypothetical protein
VARDWRGSGSWQGWSDDMQVVFDGLWYTFGSAQCLQTVVVAVLLEKASGSDVLPREYIMLESSAWCGNS